MADILIRNISQEALNRIDTFAARLGITRTEYIRRNLEQEDQQLHASCSPQDFAKFANLADEELMRKAWS